MASSFLTKKAQQQAKKIDDEHGAGNYGGTASLKPNTGKPASAPVNNGGGNGTPVTRASDFLARKAKERAGAIEREYGADAYGATASLDLDKEAGFNNWLSEVRTLNGQLAREYADRQGKYQSADSFNKYLSDRGANIGVLQDRANAYRGYFENNRDLYDAETIQGIMGALDEYGAYLGNVRGDLGKEAAYWNKFADEDAYNWNQKLLRWQDIPNAADYAEKSVYVDTYDPSKEKFNALSGTYTGTGYDDILYAYINQQKRAQEIQGLNDVGGPFTMYSTTHDYWKDLPEDVIKTFNYIYATEGSDAAYEYINATVDKSYTGIEALALGTLQGSGLSSLSAAIGSGLSKLTGDEDMAKRNEDWYTQLLRETAASSSEHPTASRVGQGAGALGTMLGISYGIGAIPAVAGLPTWVSGIVSSAGSLAGTTAIQEAGAAATGQIKPGDYALDVAISGGAGAIGGLASAGAAAGGRTLLMNLGLTNNTLANSIVAGTSGTAFSLGSTAVGEVSKYLRDREVYELDEGQVLQDALTAFAFASISYAIRNAGTSGNAAPQEDPNRRPDSEYFRDIDNIDDLKKAYRNLVKANHPDVGGDTATMAKINGEFEAMERWFIQQSANRAAEAYQQREQQAAAGQDTSAADEALRQEAGVLMGAVNDGTLTSTEAVQAAEIIQAVASAGTTGGIVAQAGDMAPSVEPAPSVPTVDEIVAAVQPTQPTKAPEAPISPEQGRIVNIFTSNVANAARNAGIDTGDYYRATQDMNAYALTPSDLEAIADAIAPVVDAIGNEKYAGYPDRMRQIAQEARGSSVEGLARPQEAPIQEQPPVDTPAEAKPQAPSEAPQATEEVLPADPAILNKEAVAQFAKTLGKAGERVLTGLYDESVDATEYINAMSAYYNSGKEQPSVPFSTKKPAPPLTLEQAEWAYTAGQNDAPKLKNAKSSIQIAKSGERFSSTLFHGSGKSKEEIYAWTQYPVAGKGKYYAMSKKAAKEYGGKVSEEEVTLERPYVINDDDDWSRILTSVGAKYRVFAGLPDDEVIRISDGIRTTLMNDGYDGIVVQYEGEKRGDVNGRTQVSVKAIDKVFGGDQVVVYSADEPVAENGGMGYTEDQKVTLPYEQEHALLDYKSSRSYVINAVLREGGELSAEDRQYVSDLDAALLKLPKFSGTLYRNITFDDFGGKDAFDEFMAGHAEGDIVTYAGYTSTSTKPDGYPLEGKYVVHLIVPESSSAHDVAGFGNNFENEAIYEREADFIVDRIVYDENGEPTVYLKEADANGIRQEADEGRNRRDRRGKQGPPDEERSNVLQQVRSENAENGNVQKVPAEDTARNSDAEGALQGVQAEVTPSSALADKIANRLASGNGFNSGWLFEQADKLYGGTMAQGTYTPKDAYDAMELGVNKALIKSHKVKLANSYAITAKKMLDQLETMLKLLPTQTKRTTEQEQFQQFSTPPNIAYPAAWVAGITANDVVLEPSAGIGGLALWPKAWGATVYANELSKRRLALLDQLGLDGTFNENAEQINNVLPDYVKPTVVLMNPPFSSTAGRTATNKTSNAERHIEQALERLEPNGRLVAILGRGMADDAPAFKKWWGKIKSEYNVRANIRIDGSNYKKYGTTFDVQLVVIDKTGATTGATVTGSYNDLSEIPNVLEAIRNDRQEIVRGGDLGVDRRAAERRNVAGGRADGGSASGRSSAVVGAEQPGMPSGDGLAQRNGKGDGGKLRADAGATGGNVAADRGSRGGDLGQGAGQGSLDAGSRGSGSAKPDTDGRSPKRSGVQPVEQTAAREKEPAQGNMDALTENPDNVYATYTPRKARFQGSVKHPAKLVESAAMSAVEPPDVTYTPNLPQKLITSGVLSDAQLENVTYAGQAHTQLLPDGRRKGYFIGDGTGVGKGRQIAGIILDNYRQGRNKALWISKGQNLFEDAVRDWTALGGSKDDVRSIYKTKPDNALPKEDGITFLAYKALTEPRRMKQLEQWLGKDFDGVIVFDEAHQMGNALAMKGKRGATKPAQTALAGIELQKMFPNARVVYASATGATKVSNYAYLERLGLWGKGTAFNDVRDFVEKISNGGLAAMELVARDMKAMGLYMARSISYDNVVYDTLQHDLTPMQTEIYNTMSRAWQKVFQNVNTALEESGGNRNSNARSTALGQFYTTLQSFYNQVLTSMSVPSMVEDIRKELDNGKSVVIQLTNTNEAAQQRAVAKAEDEGLDLDELDMTPREKLISYLQKSFPVQVYEEYTDENGNTRSRPVYDAAGNPVIDRKLVRQRDALIEELSQMKVPDGPLEMIFDAFGTDQVAEMTGRTQRVVEKRDKNGNMRRTVERLSTTKSLADAKAFQDGKKRILVFSEAGGTGKSYHADLNAKNQQQRVHYLLQPGWKADSAVQGFGRTHRSNEASAPIYKLVTTNVMGQKRFTSTIARRLDQLGALTKGQRQTGSGMFGEKDNLENPLAYDALQQFYKTMSKDTARRMGLYDSLFDNFGLYKPKGDVDRDVAKFLNRVLALEIDEQNEVFGGFYDTFTRMMDAAIERGEVDMGLENVVADKIEVNDEKTIRTDETGAETKYVQLTAYKKPKLLTLQDVQRSSGFKGLVRMENGDVRAVISLAPRTNPKTFEIENRYRLQSPDSAKISTYIQSTFDEKTTTIPKSEWSQAWKDATNSLPQYHDEKLHLLTGTLLPIWDKLPTTDTRVMRVVTSDRQYLGRLIRATDIDGVLRGLGATRKQEHYTPQQVQESVMSGKMAVLRDNKARIQRRRVSGEYRMEITGNNIWYLTRQYPDIISESINYQWRYFIPTGEKGNSLISSIIKDNPVVELRSARDADEVEYSKDVTNDGAPHPERWTATRVGGTDKSPKPLSEIIAQIRHDFGFNVTSGHVRGAGVRGQFNERDKGIRSRIANDLPTVCHELGHALDNRYGILDRSITQTMRDELEKALGALAAGYKPKQYASEGLAEFLRQFLQNRETAAIDYPEFTKHFLSKLDGKDLALIEQLADDVNAYYSLDADSAASSIRLREEGGPDPRTNKEKIRQMGDDVYQAWVDSNHGIKLFDEATGSDVYKMATNSAYSDAIAGRIITGDLTSPSGQYVGPGLKTALHGVNTRDKKEYKAFGEYLIMRHGPEYLAEGMRVFADDRKNSTAWMQRRQMELEQQYPEFEAAAKRLYQFIADLNETWGVNTNVIGRNQLAEWQQRWPNYVPFNRAVGKDGRRGAKRGFANQTNPYKRAKGSGLDFVHPVDNVINNIVTLVNVGTRNNVMHALREAALGMGADATFMEKVPTPMVPKSFDMTGVKEQLSEKISTSNLHSDDKIQADKIIASLDDVLLQFSRGKAHGNVVTVMVDGSPEFWKINDPLLLESVTALSGAKLHGFLDAYAKTTRFMTANITGNNPVWSIFSNAPRDLGTFAVYSKNKQPFKAAAAIGSGYINAFRERFKDGKGIDPLYAEYLAMGGGQTSAYSADTDLARKARNKLTSTKAQRVLDTANPLNWISFISDTIEQGPRFATYRMMRQAGLTPQEAFYEAMDVTTNFRRGGVKSRDVNKVVPFFNASVQGVDKFGRYFTGEDAPKGSRAKTVRSRWIGFFAASAILAALMYALNNRDEETKKDYQQLSTYTKNSFWCIPMGDGKYFAIPKPRELAVLASFFETCMESYIGGNDHAFDGFYEYAANNFLPSVVSDLAQLPSNIAEAGTQQGIMDTAAGMIGSAGIAGTGAYMMANRDFLGRPIESAAMRYLEPKDRYNSSTSKMAYWLGQAFDLSPTMVDYFGNQVLGYLWKAPRALFPVGGEADVTLGVKSTYAKDNVYSQDLVNWLYDKAERSAQAKKSDQENMDKAITAKLDSSMTEFYGNFNSLNKDKADTNERRHTRQVVLDMISDYRTASDAGDVTRGERAVFNVVKAAGDTSYMPSVMNTFVKDGNDVKHKLTDEQYVTYQTRYLALYWDYAEKNLSTGMKAAEKQAVLKAAKEVAKGQATNAMLKRLGATPTDYVEKYGSVKDGDVIRFKSEIDLADDDGSLKQDEVIDILKVMVDEGLDYESAYTLFHSRYDSDKNNPWRKHKP